MVTPTSNLQKRIDDISAQIEKYARRLQLLKEREAIGGINVDPAVTMEIEDLETQILPPLQSALQQAKQQQAAESLPQKSKLSDRLRADQTLYRQFCSLKRKWTELARTTGLLPGLAKDWEEYTDDIEQYAHGLVPEDWGAEDIFVLCCSVYLHKIGLVPSNLPAGKPTNVFEQCPLLSKDYVLKVGHMLDLDSDQKEDVAWVCYGHRNLVREDGSVEKTLVHAQLSTRTRKGRVTRVELAYYLRVLSLLGGYNASLPDISTQLYFMNLGPDYEEYRINSVVSGFELRAPTENSDASILLKPRLSTKDLISDLRYLQKARNSLVNACRDCPRQASSNYIANMAVEIDYPLLAEQLQEKVPTEQFRGVLATATRNSVTALLDARYGQGSPQLRGWGPMHFHPRGADPASLQFPKEVQEARVANTAEVFLALASWLNSADHRDPLVPQVIETINDVMPSLKTVQVENIPQSNQVAIPPSRPSTGEDASARPSHPYNPLASLTFVVPTTRANGLFVLAAAKLLKAMQEHAGLNLCRRDTQEIMRDCIDWLCHTNTGPFNEKILKFLPNDYLFQSILGFKALINSREHWMGLNVDFPYAVVESKTAEFVHSMLDHYASDKSRPATPFKAMALEILLFYRGQNDEAVFSRKVEVDRLARSFAQDLLDEVSLESSLPWEDNSQTLTDEDRKHSRPWTHVTSVWAIEGLTYCMSANLLTRIQKGRFLQTVPLVLATQNSDGFYDSTRHPDDPESTTIRYIFKTALYTYALTQFGRALSAS